MSVRDDSELAHIEKSVVRRALHFMLQHPLSSTINEIKGLARAFIGLLAILAVALLVAIGSSAEAFNQVAFFYRHDITKPSQVFVYVGYSALACFGLLILLLVAAAVVPVLRSRSTLGNSLAIMISVVAIFFLQS